MKNGGRIIIVAVISIFAACAAESDVSSLQIDSGKFITADSETTIPGVVSIDGCTATAVSDNTLITAGHCVSVGQQVCIRSGQLSEGVCSDDVNVPSAWLREVYEEDIAVVIFPQGTFKHYFEVQQQQVNRGDEVLMVGYSDYSIGRNDRDKGTKRWGKNQVSRFDPGRVIITSYGFSADKVAVNPGDSGGPMFSGCKLIGIASRTNGYGSFRGKTSLHTNVLTNMGFLRGLSDRGATYCGLPGADAARCPLSGRAEPVQSSGDRFPCTESTTPTEPPAEKLYALLAGNGSQVKIYLAAPAAAQSAHMCPGIGPDCDDSLKIEFTNQTSRDGVDFFSSSSLVDLGVGGGEFTAIARDSAGNIMGQSLFRIEK